MVKRPFVIGFELCILILINQLGVWLVKTFHIPLPGNVIGMIILFLLLVTNVVKLQRIETTALFLNKHLGFFFIPICVGLMTLGPVLLENGLDILLILVVSLIIGLVAAGFFTQIFVKKKEGKTVGHHHHSV